MADRGGSGGAGGDFVVPFVDASGLVARGPFQTRAANTEAPTLLPTSDTRSTDAMASRVSPDGSFDHAQKAATVCPRIHALKTPPKANRLNRRKPGVYLKVSQTDLLVGFAADFWAWLVDLGGGGSCAPGSFVFGWWIFRRIFSADFSLVFCDPKIHCKNPQVNPPLPWRPFGRFSSVLNPRPAVSYFKFSTGTPPEIGIRFFCPLFFGHVYSSELLEHGNRSSGNTKTSKF